MGEWWFGEIKPCGPLRHDLQLSHRLTSINHQTRQNVLQRNFLMPQTTFFTHILTGMRHAVNLDACDMTWHSRNTTVCFTGEINFKEASLFHQTNYWWFLFSKNHVFQSIFSSHRFVLIKSTCNKLWWICTTCVKDLENSTVATRTAVPSLKKAAFMNVPGMWHTRM